MIARSLDSPYVGTEHVLLGVLAQNSSLGAKILANSGVTLDRVEMALDLTAKQVVVMLVRNGLSDELMKMIRTAWQVANEFGQEKIGTEHILYSIVLQREARATRLLRDMNVNVDGLQGELESVFDRQQNESLHSAGVKSTAGSGRTASRQPKELARFSIDLTERARLGLLDPVIGREDEIQRMITILGRRSKNNPALIGEPGVGKTAVVEGLAQRIADGQVPDFLLGRQVVQLDMSSLVAGTQFRGQFEERLQKLLSVVKHRQEIILFIDELHVMVGAGSAEGAMDAANILKPALSRGEMRLIGATTFDEYRKYIEKDTALSRRFQPITVNQPSVEQATAMLVGLSQRLSQHHRVHIPPEMLQLAVELSNRYVPDRQLPDKAVDVIDEAAALLRSHLTPKQTRRDKLTRQIKQLTGRLDAAVEAENYEQAALLKVQLRQLEQRIAQLPATNEKLVSLTEADVRRAVSQMTQIPVERINNRQARDLRHLEKRLRSAVVGQDEAVSELARAVRRSRAGLNRSTGPLGSFIFLGPTGVGKTELARVLAREVFGGDDCLIKIDMSEFAEKHTAARLVGAPAGYVGYDDGGKLTDAVRRRPYSVVLFDEIEKAHPDVLNLLLQLLEDGQVTDATGRAVSFRQTIVILTSNVGAEAMVREGSLGFTAQRSADKQADQNHQHNARAAISELEEFLRPELIGRFDQVLTFRPLDRRAVGKIFDKLLQEPTEALVAQGITLEVTPAAKRWLISQGFDEQRGARVLRQTIQRHLVDRLSDSLLSGAAKAGDRLRVTTAKGAIVVHVDHP